MVVFLVVVVVIVIRGRGVGTSAHTVATGYQHFKREPSEV